MMLMQDVEVEAPEELQKKLRKKPLHSRIFLSNAFKILFPLCIVATILPLTIYFFMFAGVSDNFEKTNLYYGSCSHEIKHRVPCGKRSVGELGCAALLCCFDRDWGCYHTMPSLYTYLSYDKRTSDTIYTPRQPLTPVNSKALSELKLAVNAVNDWRLQLTLYDHKKNEYESKEPEETANYQYVISEPEMFITVTRDGRDMLLTTTRGALYASEKFWEWNFYLGDGPLFGLGDFIIGPEETRLMFNNGVNTTLPIVLAYNETADSWHGLVISAPGPTEFYTLPSGVVTVKCLAASAITLDLFVGPTLADITNQLELAYGSPKIPPYWALGIHVCRDYYDHDEISDATDFENMLKEIDDFIDAAVPFDSHCLQEAQFWLSDAADLYDSVLDKLSQKLETPKRRFMPSVVPHLSIDKYIPNTPMYHNQFKNETYVGTLRNRKAVYPVLNDETMGTWLTKNWPTYLDRSDIEGYVLTNNWPSDSVNLPAPTTLDFPSLPKYMNISINGTPPWQIEYNDVSLFSTHNLYGLQHGKLIQEKLLSHATTQDSANFILSTTYGIGGDFIGLAQNVTPTWTELRRRVQRAIGQGITNSRFATAPICGDVGNKTLEELCIRWHMVGALFPIFRVRSDRSAAEYEDLTVRKILTSAMRFRYAMLPYIYTEMQTKEPVIRPMFYNYLDKMNDTKTLDEQFLLGRAILVAPVLLPGLIIVRFYAPEDYFEFHGGTRYEEGWNEIPVVESDLPIFIAPGHIVVTQENNKELTLEEVRKNTAYTAVVALKCDPGTLCSAYGEMYINEHISWEFKADKYAISVTVTATDPTYIDEYLCGPNKIANGQVSNMRIFGHPDNFPDTFFKGIDLDVCKISPNGETTINFTCTFAKYANEELLCE